jgi:hypothetical protein
MSYTVYTTDHAIHDVPKDALDKMGPQTLASVTSIAEIVPWDEKKLKEFKAKREKAIKKEVEEFKANAEDTSISSWAEREGDTREFIVRFGDAYPFKYVLSAEALNSLRDGINEISTIHERQGSLGASWVGDKVKLLKVELLRRKNQEIMDSKRKDLTSQIEKLQKELKDLK